MDIRVSDRLGGIASYAFSDIDQQVARLAATGITPIDFGVGDPHDPPFDTVLARTARALEEQKCSGYPSYVGHPEFRRAVAAYCAERFGVDVDPDREVISSVGSKELVFHLPEAFVNPGEVVIAPNPGYPPYLRGTLFAEGVPYLVNLEADHGFLPDLEAIPTAIWERARLIWVCYPNNPTTAFATDAFYEKLLWFAARHGVIVASDEAYIENYFDERPRSLLEFSRDGVVVLQSLSKMANMTMFRVGFAVGDERIIAALKKLKTNIDSGTPTFIQLGALPAFTDRAALDALRAGYRAKAEVLQKVLAGKGFPVVRPQGSIYLWQRAPVGYDGLALAKRLLEPDLGIVVTPGVMLASEVQGTNPGASYVRLALTPTLAEVDEAAARLARATF